MCKFIRMSTTLTEQLEFRESTKCFPVGWVKLKGKETVKGELGEEKVILEFCCQQEGQGGTQGQEGSMSSLASQDEA